MHPVTRRVTLPLPALLLLPVVVLGTTSCGHLNGLMAGQPQPEVTVRDVTLQQANLRRIALRVDLDVKNPYAVSLPVVGFRYRVWISGVQLADGSIQVDRPIPARGSAPLHTDVAFGPVDAARAVTRLATGDRRYQLEGTLTVRTPMGELGVRIRRSGRLTGASVPKGLGRGFGLGRLL